MELTRFCNETLQMLYIYLGLYMVHLLIMTNQKEGFQYILFIDHCRKFHVILAGLEEVLLADGMPQKKVLELAWWLPQPGCW